MDDLDRELERRGHRFARYADDVLVLVKSLRAGERVKASLTGYLTQRLKLQVNEQKSRVAPIDQCVFLGFTFRKGKLRWSARAFEDFKHNVRRFTGRSWGVSMRYRFNKLAQYLRGWMGYFGISEYYRTGTRDRRVAAPTCAHVLLEAVASGAHEGAASACARHWKAPCDSDGHQRAKSYWRLSKTLATQAGMTNYG